MKKTPSPRGRGDSFRLRKSYPKSDICGRYAGKFADSGVRSEIDVFMSEDGPRPSSPVQREVALMG